MQTHDKPKDAKFDPCWLSLYNTLKFLYFENTTQHNIFFTVNIYDILEHGGTWAVMRGSIFQQTQNPKYLLLSIFQLKVPPLLTYSQL